MDTQNQFEPDISVAETTPIDTIPQQIAGDTTHNNPTQDMVQHSNNIARVASLLFVLVFLFVSLLLIMGRVDKFIRIKAMDDCARASRFEQKIDRQNAVASYPIEGLYNKCLKEKGI